MSTAPFDPDLIADLKNSLADLLEDSDWASELLPDFDYESQLVAINALIQRNKEAERVHSERMKALEVASSTAEGEHGSWIEGEWLDAAHYSVYHDAANSMAALGMIAPFIETLFARAFATIGALERTSGTSRTALSADDFWNCRFAWTRGYGRKEDIALGIWQLAEATELSIYLPSGLRPRLASLFAYRNYMFHNGLEWPKEARIKFAARMEKEEWTTHFSMATSDDAPWVIYFSESAIDWWLAALPDVLGGIGRYFKERVRPHVQVPSGNSPANDSIDISEEPEKT